MLGSRFSRARKFNPEKLFIVLLQLIGGKNGEGYFHALLWTWDLFSDLRDAPVKSALSKMRQRVSFEFFREHTDNLVRDFEPHRRTWRGLHVYATDGDQYELPASGEILDQGYRGYPCKDGKETHYPRMYVVHCYDVLSGVTKDFRYSNQNQEVGLAVEIAKSVEGKSLTLYDRLFLGSELIGAHAYSKSFFIARCREGATFTEIKEFFKSNRRNYSFEAEGVQIHLIKVINPKTGQASVFATNLPKDRFRNREISELYTLRWEAETANRDLSSTMKVEQWHAKTLNGILQEIYTALWLMNQARIQMSIRQKSRPRLSQIMKYTKSNFKLIVDFILQNLHLLIEKRSAAIKKKLLHVLNISRQRRRRRTRSYPRQVKYSRNTYPSASTIKRRPAA